MIDLCCFTEDTNGRSSGRFWVRRSDVVQIQELDKDRFVLWVNSGCSSERPISITCLGSAVDAVDVWSA